MSNEAVQMVVCAVCAREVDKRGDQVTELDLSILPNSQQLIPKQMHSAHDLFDGRLLEPEGVVRLGEGVTMMRVCKLCMDELSDSRTEKPPTFSLANNLWIGRIPWELRRLTFSEQIIITHLYPRVYVFKLYPKDLNCQPNKSTLQHGMRGNVSTYDLDAKGVASMVQGNLMPHPTLILPLVISVTFIGKGSVPKQSLHSIFRVHRQIVFEALKWLKENNPKYYGEIEINEDFLCALPDDDVPMEILSIIRQSDDIGIIDQESSGYVPIEGDDVEGELLFDNADALDSKIYLSRCQYGYTGINCDIQK